MKAVLGAAAALTILPAAAVFAQPAAQLPEPKISQLIVYGSDPCPAGTDDTIIVCARKPEGERYRIPEALRSDPNDPGNQAWATRATAMEYIGRGGTESCSSVGPGGSTGCFNQIVREARAEWAQKGTLSWSGMIEKAREEREAKIQAEAKASEPGATTPPTEPRPPQ